MTIDLSDRNWKLKRSLAFNRFTSRSPKPIGLPMKGRLLRVEARFPTAKSNWVKAGSLHQIYMGSTPPSGTVIAFGQQLVTMANLTPYTLLFRPVPYLPDGYLRIWEYIPSLTDRDLLDLSVQQDNSILSTITQLFTEIMSTDIRATKQAIAANQTATQAAQAAANLADSKAVNAQTAANTNAASIQSALSTIATNASEMVRKFGPVAITASEFILNSVSGVYEYVLTHGLNDEVPEVEVIDSDKDVQLIQPTGIDANSVKLELTSDDMTTNAWPLYAVVFGKSGSAMPTTTPGGQKVALEGGWKASLVEKVLTIFKPDGSVLGAGAPDTLGVYYLGGNKLNISTSNPAFLYGIVNYSESGVTFEGLTQAQYELAISTGIRI